MSYVAALLLASLGADPTPAQLELLKVFRSEFVPLTPGEGKFPAEFSVGRAQGGSDAERPVAKIKLSQPFAMAKYEVPQNLWEALMGGNPSRWKGKRNSVEMMTYDESVQFCQRATALMRAAKLIEADDEIRLPSEAEWEYAARAGTTTVYAFGDDVEQLGKYAWFTGNAAGNDPPVGAKEPNAWGLYDMHGYLWEFCADEWRATLEGIPQDGQARPVSGDAPATRVLRSGSWKDKADSLTSTARRPAPAALRDDAVGLRCVLAKQRPARR